MATDNDTGAEPSSFDAAVSAFDSLLSAPQETGTEDQKAQRQAKPTAQAAEADPDDDDQQQQADDDGADPNAAEGAGDGDGNPDTSEEGEEGAGEQDDEQSAEADDDDPVYAITVDGEETEVPLSELAKGYIREASFTRKSQALAEDRKAFMGEVEQTRGLRAQYARGLEQLNAVLAELTPQEPDWDRLRVEDPQRYGVEWADHQRRLLLKENVQREKQAAEQQALEDLNRQRLKNIAEGGKWLMSQVPEWTDPKTGADRAKADRDAIRAYGLKMGFSEADLKAIDDPRAILLLYKAMRFDRAGQRKGEVVKMQGGLRVVKPAGAGQKPAQQQTTQQQSQQRAPAAPMKPGTTKANSKLSRQTTDLTRSKQRHAKVGTVRSATEVFRNLLG